MFLILQTATAARRRSRNHVICCLTNISVKCVPLSARCSGACLQSGVQQRGCSPDVTLGRVSRAEMEDEKRGQEETVMGEGVCVSVCGGADAGADTYKWNPNSEKKMVIEDYTHKKLAHSQTERCKIQIDGWSSMSRNLVFARRLVLRYQPWVATAYM